METALLRPNFVTILLKSSKTANRVIALALLFDCEVFRIPFLHGVSVFFGDALYFPKKNRIRYRVLVEDRIDKALVNFGLLSSISTFWTGPEAIQS